MAGFRCSGAEGVCLAFLLIATLAPAEAGTLEYAVKATFLYKFAAFVTWPQGAAPGADGTFHLCVSGSDAVVPLVAVAAKGQELDGKPIVAKEIAPGADPAGCDVLYIAAADSDDGKRMLERAHGRPILTVTDGAQEGEHGIIAFGVIDRHVRFTIDENLASAGGLTISSKLLSLASAVTPPAEKP